MCNVIEIVCLCLHGHDCTCTANKLKILHYRNQSLEHTQKDIQNFGCEFTLLSASSTGHATAITTGHCIAHYQALEKKT